MEYGSIQPVQLEQAKIVTDSVARGNGHMLEASRQGVYLAVALIAAHSLWSDGYTKKQLALILSGLVVSVIASAVCHFLVGFIEVNNIAKFLKGSLEFKEGMNWNLPAWLAGGVQLILVVASIFIIIFG